MVSLRITAHSASSASPPRTVSIKRPCDVVVSAHVSPRDLKPAFLAVIAASVFNRSRVDRASRSSRVTVSTSPASSANAKNNLVFVPFPSNNAYPDCLTGCIAVFGRSE